MIYFSSSEILISVIASALYGVLFSLFSLAFVVFACLFKEFFRSVKNAFDYSIKLSAIPLKNPNKSTGGVYVFLGIIAFSLGYVLLCYFSLDASFRLYVLLISATTYFIFYSFINKIITPILNAIIFRVLFCLSAVLRIFAFPFFKIYVYIKEKKDKNKV